MRSRIALIIFSFLLTGCGHIKGDGAPYRNRAKDYHRSELVAPLEVPSDMHRIAASDQYPIPDDIPMGVVGVELSPPFFDEDDE